jgi:hypothetical protein
MLIVKGKNNSSNQQAESLSSFKIDPYRLPLTVGPFMGDPEYSD